MDQLKGIEKVVEVLKPHWERISEHFDEENEKFKELFSNDHEVIGKVLKCHLIVENYLDSFLEEHYGINDIDAARLSYFQKAKLIPDSKSSVTLIKPGVLQLNTIRNRYGHNLDAEVKSEELNQINRVLDIFRKEQKFEDAIDRIEAFTSIACTALTVNPSEIQEIFTEAFSHIEIDAIDHD